MTLAKLAAVFGCAVAVSIVVGCASSSSMLDQKHRLQPIAVPQ